MNTARFTGKSAYSIFAYSSERENRVLLDGEYAISGIYDLSVLHPRLRRMIDDQSRDRIGGEPRELLLRAAARLTMTKGRGASAVGESFMEQCRRRECRALLATTAAPQNRVDGQAPFRVDRLRCGCHSRFLPLGARGIRIVRTLKARYDKTGGATAT